VFGQVYTTPAKSSFLTSLGTPLTAVIGLLVHRTVPTRAQRLAIALASIGLVLLTWPPAGARLNHGDLLTIACAIVYAVFVVEAARRAPRHDPLALAVGLVIVSATTYLVCWAACRAAIALLPPEGWPALLRLEARPFPRGLRVALELAYMAVVCVALVMPVQTWALQRLSATTAAIIFALEPVVATALAVAVGGASEWPGARGATGGFLVLCAVYAAEGKRLRRRRRPTSASSASGPSSGGDPPPTEQPEDLGPQ
jgi:drug/metabolite transporter (DMT)-like permease